MPLVKECSIEAYRENIRTEVKAGRTPEQAVAISLNTVRTACDKAGKPLPQGIPTVQKGKSVSREYLEAALEQAKKLLPGWMYAVLHRAALPSSGGRAAVNRRLSLQEKAWLHGVDNLSDGDLKTLSSEVSNLRADVVFKGKDTVAVDARLRSIARCMDQRGLELSENCASLKKGFLWGRPEAGMHLHGLDRRNAKTFLDGRHVHSFYLPGTGEHVVTVEDGLHAHSILKDGQNTDDAEAMSGRHSHKVCLPDGTELETKLGGEHGHALMVETSGFDGRHGHVLELPDGTTIKSLTVKQFLDRMQLDGMGPFGAAPCASEITNAINELHYMREREMERSTAVEYMPVGPVAMEHVAFSGSPDARLVFVGSSPSLLELARKEAIIGPDGAVFAERYLKPLSLSRDDVAVGFAIPVFCEEDPGESEIELWRDRLLKEIAQYPKSRVIALGRVAKAALGPLAVCTLPHPAALRRRRDSGEVARKLKALTKRLDISEKILDHGGSPACTPIDTRTGRTDSIGELQKSGKVRVPVVKGVQKKQIVYGVILDPYQVDLQGDWIPPSEIEATAHDFLEKSRVIGLRHAGKADAQVVESWVEAYPTEKDREAALENRPHKVLRRQFGADTIHSGAWIAGVKLSDRLWKQYECGELDAFSIGGFSFKTQVSVEAMPQVQFVDLVAGG